MFFTRRAGISLAGPSSSNLSNASHLPSPIASRMACLLVSRSGALALILLLGVLGSHLL